MGRLPPLYVHLHYAVTRHLVTGVGQKYLLNHEDQFFLLLVPAM